MSTVIPSTSTVERSQGFEHIVTNENDPSSNHGDNDQLKSKGSVNSSSSSSLDINSTPQRPKLDAPVDVFRRSSNAITFPRRNSSPLPQNRGRNFNQRKNHLEEPNESSTTLLNVINESPKPLKMELQTSLDTITPRPIAIRGSSNPSSLKPTLSISPSSGSKSSIADPETTSLDVVSISSTSRDKLDKESINSGESTEHSLAETSLLGLGLNIDPHNSSDISSAGSGFFANVFSNTLNSTSRKNLTDDSKVQSTNNTSIDEILESRDSIDEQVSSPTMLSYRPSKRTTKPRSSSSASSNSQTMNSPLKQVNDKKSDVLFDKNLYQEETLPGTNIHYALKDRHVQFMALFPSIDDANLLDDFVCGLTRKEMPLLPIQGRLYVSNKGVHFYSSILGWTTNFSVLFSEIEQFEKSMSVGVFNNGIKIIKRNIEPNYSEEIGFVGFLKRDSVLLLLEEAFRWWKINFLNVDHVIENNSQENLENDYQTALMSIDGDTPRRSRSFSDSECEVYSEIDTDEDHQRSKSPLSSSTTSSHTIHKFKSGAKYKAPSSTIYIHNPTDGPTSSLHPNEIELTKLTLPIPPSLLFQLLFDNENTDLTVDFLKTQDSSEFSNFTPYILENNTAKIKERRYSYQKALNFPVGPKSTTCEVQDQIIHEDQSTYYEVINITKTPAVPSGGSFDVRTRYILTWGEENDTVLRVSFWVEWSGSSWIKGMIESSCKSGQEEATKGLTRLVTDYVEEYVETSSVSEESINSFKKKKEKTTVETKLKKMNTKKNKPSKDIVPIVNPTVRKEGWFIPKSEINISNLIFFIFLLIIVIQQTIIIYQISTMNSQLIKSKFMEHNIQDESDDFHLILKYLNEKNIGGLDRLEMSHLIKKEIDLVIEKWIQQGN